MIRRNSLTSSEGVEQLITRNMVNYLVNRLQESTEKFTQSQRDYLKGKITIYLISTFSKDDRLSISAIKSREEKSKQFLIDFDDMEENGEQHSSILSEGDRLIWGKHDLMALEENTKFVNKREKEITAIVQSISDLNTIFRDLASMIAEQV